MFGTSAAGLTRHVTSKYGVDGVEVAGLAGPDGPDHQDVDIVHLKASERCIQVNVGLECLETQRYHTHINIVEMDIKTIYIVRTASANQYTYMYMYPL